MPNVPYPYEVNWQLVTGNGSLSPICSLSKRSLSTSLTVSSNKSKQFNEKKLFQNKTFYILDSLISEFNNDISLLEYHKNFSQWSLDIA